jgi:hypothetical protein
VPPGGLEPPTVGLKGTSKQNQRTRAFRPSFLVWSRPSRTRSSLVPVSRSPEARTVSNHSSASNRSPITRCLRRPSRLVLRTRHKIHPPPASEALRRSRTCSRTHPGHARFLALPVREPDEVLISWSAWRRRSGAASCGGLRRSRGEWQRTFDSDSPCGCMPLSQYARRYLAASSRSPINSSGNPGSG